MSTVSPRASLLEGLDHAVKTSSTSEVAQSLRALQRSGLSQSDLRVHVERLRAVNEATVNDEGAEERLLYALDVIAGETGNLHWDPGSVAQSALFRLSESLPLEDAMVNAVLPSDLLPVSTTRHLERKGLGSLAAEFRKRHDEDRLPAPSAAFFVRAPKREFTTRPAALLSFTDRVYYEALARMIAARLDNVQPSEVKWPRRGIPSREGYTSFRDATRGFDSPYLVKADIENFYEYVDHAILARTARDLLGMSQSYCIALESLLDAVMNSTRGLPQGPVASESFASLYLLPVDIVIAESEWLYVRYQDDYHFPATTYPEARDSLQQFETILREIGLRLSTHKTAIVTHRTIEREAARATPYSASSAMDRADEHRHGGTAAPSESFAALVESLSSGQNWEAYLQLRESLAYCSASGDTSVPIESIGIALDWFPQLTSDAALFLAKKRDLATDEIDAFISLRIEASPSSDWENAWLCRIPQLSSSALTDRLRGFLFDLAEDHVATPMTRFNAYCALARAGYGTDKLKQTITDSLPEPLVSELRLELLADAQHQSLEPPWRPD